MPDSTRLAVPDDSDALAEVHVTAWQEAYEGILPDEFLTGLDRQARRRWWRDKLESGARVQVVETPAVGFCFVGGADDERWGEVYAIYVHPERWGSGLGHGLLAAGMEQLRSMGYERALLWVLEDNERARRFYERQGWRIGRPIRIEEIGGAQVTELRYEIDL